MKKFLALTAIILSAWVNLQAKPVAGITSISWNTNRAMTIASLIEQHTLTILKEHSSIDVIDAGIINRELSKFGCFDERCIASFAADAGINLIIKGDVQDRGSYINITLRSYGFNSLMGGKLLYEYSVKIPLDVPAGAREFSLLSEEHSAEFISGTLAAFSHDIRIKKTGDVYTADTVLKLNGKYALYNKNSSGSLVKTGEIVLNESHAASENVVPDNSFIILSYKTESAAIKKFYVSRKREILFRQGSCSDSLFAVMITPFASASMPFASPFLGYYTNNDWSGLGLWMVNATPYIYMEARGLFYSPSRLKDNNENVTRDDIAMHNFGLYMLAAGGLPLFIDSYANNYLRHATYFSGDTRFLGSNTTAAYLSLVSNGGGMFYKGYRSWGYFYFHLNNILLYMTLRDFAKPEEYISATDSYQKKEANTGRGKKLCAVLAASKIIETVHTLLIREDLTNGEVTESSLLPEPYFIMDEKNNPVYGVSLSFKF